MSENVMTSAEVAGGPKSLEKQIFFILFNENEQTFIWFLLEMHNSKKSTHPTVQELIKGP
jgi:hypothetical protein